MKNALILFITLLITWFVLSGFFDPLFISFGLISCLLSVFITIKLTKSHSNFENTSKIILKLPLYTVWLMFEIVKSAIDVTTKVWQLNPDISPKIDNIPAKVKGDLALTILGNSISLTPGTVSIEINEDENSIQVHALNADGIEELKKGNMQNKVKSLIQKKD